MLRTSLRASMAEGALAELVGACTSGGVLTAWALYLELPPMLIGVLGALPFTAQLVHLPASWFTRRIGGRIAARASADSRIRFAAQAFLLEVVFLSAASFCSIGYRSDLLGHSFQPLVLIAFTGLAMGTRNAVVRKLAIPDLTTTVLTLTVTGIAADSSLANGNNPRLARRVGSVLAIFFGAALGAFLIHYSISTALWLATAMSAVCSAALFRSVRRPDKR